MWLIDQMAERHIQEAMEKGELSGLPGEGKPLVLDDDSQVPAELRASFRLLKNAGYLPPELEIRRVGLELVDLLDQLDPEDQQAAEYRRKLRAIELQLQKSGQSTAFLHHGRYGDQAVGKLHGDGN